jgi:(2Fe-2S) ferredoxin
MWASGFQLTNTGCLGPCHLGPSVLVYPEGIMYTGVKLEDVGTIID